MDNHISARQTREVYQENAKGVNTAGHNMPKRGVDDLRRAFAAATYDVCICVRLRKTHLHS